MLPGKRYKPEELFHIAWRWRWVILAPWVAVSMGTFVVVQKLPDRFRSESVIQVVPPRVPENYVRSAITTKLDERLPVISQLIMSRTRLERVIQDFDLYSKERKVMLMEDVVNRMRDDIVVQIAKGDAFRVAYMSGEAKTAMKVTERLASLFVEENLRDREGLAEGANQFLESQLDDARRRLLEHEKKLEEYRRKFNGELPSQTPANLQAIQSNQSQVQALSESINRDRDRRLMLERMLADANIDSAVSASAPTARNAAASVDGDAVTTSASIQLANARTLMRGLELRLKPEHPDILRAKRTIAELEKKAAAEALNAPVSAAADPTPPSPQEAMQRNKIRELKADMEFLDREIVRKEDNQRKLQVVIKDYQTRVDTAPTRESELIALTRDYDTLQKLYTSMLTKSEDAKVSANLERRQIGEQFKVIDPARLPEKPFSPDRRTFDSVGSVVGLAIGLGIVVILEFMNTSFRTEDDVVSVLALPVLAAIPAIVTPTEQKLVRRRHLLVACTSVTVVLCGAAAVLAWRFHSVLVWWR